MERRCSRTAEILGSIPNRSTIYIDFYSREEKSLKISFYLINKPVIFMPENRPVSKNPVKYSKPINWKQQKRKMIINHEVSKFTKAFRENFITLIVSALGLVSALSWNDAIKSAINTLFPSNSDLIYKFYVAIAVTIIAVIITYFLSRIRRKY